MCQPTADSACSPEEAGLWIAWSSKTRTAELRASRAAISPMIGRSTSSRTLSFCSEQNSLLRTPSVSPEFQSLYFAPFLGRGRSRSPR